MSGIKGINDEYYDKLSPKHKGIIGQCRLYIASVVHGIGMESIRLNAHQHLAEKLAVNWNNEKLVNILHKLDEAIDFPIQPLLPNDKTHKFWTHPDRNLSNRELIEKYEIKLFELLIKTFEVGEH